MVTGVLGAASQGELRRILSFHIVSQIGYMVLGLGLYFPLALAGSIFYTPAGDPALLARPSERQAYRGTLPRQVQRAGPGEHGCLPGEP
jgi:hypothetical protein